MIVYQDLLDKIDRMEYKTGSILPPETELQKQYNVSRITVRRALSDLEHDGRIERVRGKGSIVLMKKNNTDLYELTGFSEDAKRHGDVPASIILDFKEIECSPEIAKMLSIEPGETVYYLKRLRLINGRISGVFETYITEKLGFKIDMNEFNDKTSLYNYYEEHGVHLGDAAETIEAIMATPELKHEMFMEDDGPIFFRSRITYDNTGVPIEFSKNYYKANGYKYFVRMHRSKI